LTLRKKVPHLVDYGIKFLEQEIIATLDLPVASH